MRISMFDDCICMSRNFTHAWYSFCGVGVKGFGGMHCWRRGGGKCLFGAVGSYAVGGYRWCVLDHGSFSIGEGEGR